MKSETDADRNGYLAGRDGPNVINCHFTNFATSALMWAWVRGYERGLVEKKQQHEGVHHERT
jgi:hypothetical protein